MLGIKYTIPLKLTQWTKSWVSTFANIQNVKNLKFYSFVNQRVYTNLDRNVFTLNVKKEIKFYVELVVVICILMILLISTRKVNQKN